ncbi:MAG: hypothetical protein M3092_00235 [Actinomycetia bacterium]|nr:hypothetical protein [Actinomycetes bacterium]
MPIMDMSGVEARVPSSFWAPNTLASQAAGTIRSRSHVRMPTGLVPLGVSP